nr:MAG TPA: hypothetical protein [Caudoviricetes sp.]
MICASVDMRSGAFCASWHRTANRTHVALCDPYAFIQAGYGLMWFNSPRLHKYQTPHNPLCGVFRCNTNENSISERPCATIAHGRFCALKPLRHAAFIGRLDGRR